MKLVTFRDQGHPRAGIVVGEQVLDLVTSLISFEEAHGRKADTSTVKERYGEGVLGFIEHNADARPAADQMVAWHAENKLPPAVRVLALGDLTLLSPLPRPPSMRDGYAFRQHVETAWWFVK